MNQIIESVIIWAMGLIEKTGYLGIFITQTLESAAIPIPSEVVLPFSGFLTSSGHLNFGLVVSIATVGNLIGATAIYLVGLYGGRPILEHYGKYVLITQESIAKVDRWIESYGSETAFFSRLLPGVRTFSSLVIGATKMNFGKFLLYTFLGSLMWNLPLTYIGFVAGENWDFLRPYFHKFELAIAALFILIIVILLYKHFRKQK
jgi:membrane protein DedA with SNARE-associated domain